MKAAVFYEPEQIQLEDVPDPTAGDDEVIVRVRACGFCGSDIEYYYGKSPLGTPDGKGPLVLGHELCGEVVEAGKLAASYGLAEGDRVSVNPVQSCNACDMCRAGKVAFCPNMSVIGVTTNGGFAEYAKTKIAHAYKLPESLTDEQGAFVEMLSSAVYAVRRAEIEPGNLAVVYGPGPVGLSMVQLLKNEGARVALVGTRDYRLDVGKSLGADYVWNTRDDSSPHWTPDLAEAIQEVNGGRLADRALVATANVDANQQAIEITGPGLDGRADGARRAERRRLAVAPLEPDAGQDDPVLVALPAAVADDAPPARRREGRHGPDHHAHGVAGRDQRRDRARPPARGRGREDGDHAHERAAALLRLPGDDLPLDVRRGPRELPGGRRRGDRDLGVQARRGPVEGRRVGREAPRQRPAGDHVHSRHALGVPGPVPRAGRSGGTGRRALRGGRDVRAVRA